MTIVEVKYGVLFAVVTLLWITMEFLMGLHSTYIHLHPYFSFLFLFVVVAVIYQGVKARKSLNEGNITYLHAFLSGVYISIVAVLLSPLVNYIFHSFINPDFFDAMISMSVQQMRLTEDMAREHFNLVRYTQLNIVFGLISGVITSGLVALVLKSKKV